uniref:Uncharacterized protein n=1 Tax=viral metagenome TaxID=1070528 RepID=A0A6C0E814_9ZZZZ
MSFRKHWMYGGPQCVPCEIKDESTDKIVKGLCYKISDEIIIATSQSEQKCELNVDPTCTSKYFIYSTTTNGSSYMKIMDFKAPACGSSMSVLKLYNCDGITTYVESKSCVDVFAEYLRKDPRTSDAIKNLNMLSNLDLFNRVMSFVPKLVYLSNMTPDMVNVIIGQTRAPNWASCFITMPILKYLALDNDKIIVQFCVFEPIRLLNFKNPIILLDT